MDDLNARATTVFRWAPGMLIRTIGGPTDRIAGIDETYIHAWAESQQDLCPRGMWVRYRIDRMDKHGVMETSDPQTRGAMLEQVREAWRCDEYRRLTIDLAGSGYCVLIRNGRHRPPSRARASWDLDTSVHTSAWPKNSSELGPLGDNFFATEAEALVAAMEAASQPTK